MSATVIQEGFKTAGFNENGDLIEQDLSMVLAEVPGPNGDWCFVIQDTDFCWVKGLKTGNGYQIFKNRPLTGPDNTWGSQIEKYLGDGIPEETEDFTVVIAGTKTALAQENFYILAE